MALDIEGATFGYDASKVERAVENIKSKCIDSVTSKMDESFASLKTDVMNAWVGAAATQFMANMDADKESIKQQLNNTKKALDDVIKDQIQTVIANADESLVAARK